MSYGGGRKKSSSSRRNRPAPRDPSDSESVPIVGGRDRHHERPQPRGHPEDRMSQRQPRQPPRTPQHAHHSNGKSSTRDYPQHQRRTEKHWDQRQRERRHAGHESGRNLEGVSLAGAVSVADSALTNPSGLACSANARSTRRPPYSSNTEDEEDEDSDEDSHCRPLLGKHVRDASRNEKRASGGSKYTRHSSSRSDRHHGKGSAAISLDYLSDSGTEMSMRKKPSDDKKNRLVSAQNGDGSNTRSFVHASDSATSKTSVHGTGRHNGKKRTWFNKQNCHATAGCVSPLGSTGVKYRSASSTQRALEDLRRKRIEDQEKRRAMGVLAALFVLVGLVYPVSTGVRLPWRAEGRDVALRGSRDKVYGDTKDLGYGGERTGAVPAAKAAPVPAEADDAKDGATVEEGYEYALPEPVEKTYDDEHQYLMPLRHFADVEEPSRPADTAFFFQVPRAGSSTMKDIMGKCLNLVQSSEVGVRDGHDKDPRLEVLEVQENRYVNVDTTQVPGIQRAVDLGLASSGLVDVIVSSYLHDSAPLFDLKHQGRAFIIFRDPLARSMSMYWHRIKEVGDLDKDLSVVDYAQGKGIENNWMCRFLTNRMTGELTKVSTPFSPQFCTFLTGFHSSLSPYTGRSGPGPADPQGQIPCWIPGRPRGERCPFHEVPWLVPLNHGRNRANEARGLHSGSGHGRGRGKCSDV